MKTKLFFLLILLAPMCGWAEEFTVDSAKYEILTDGTACLVDGSLVKGDLVIPETVKSPDGSLYTVTSIGKFAFYYNNGLTSVTIPKSIQSIAQYAFVNCTKLSSVTSLIENPFYLYSSEFVILNEETQEWIERAPDRLYIPNGTADKYISRYWYEIFPVILEGVEGNSTVRIFRKDYIIYSVEADGSAAIRSCEKNNITDLSILENVTFEGVTYIPKAIKNQAFSYCRNLETLTIPNNIESIEIDYSSIFGLGAMPSAIVVKDGNPVYDSRNNCNAIIETATNTLIQGCNNTIIPQDVTAIGNWAFSNCIDLTQIKLTDNLLSIENSAFFESGLISVELPAGLTSISKYAFGCDDLMIVVSKIKNPFEIDQSTFCVYDYEQHVFRYSDATLYVPAGTIEDYIKMGWADQFAKIVEGEPGEVFKESGAIYQTQSENTVAVMVSDVVETKYVIPETVNHDGTDYTVTAINNHAFKDNIVLAEVTIPKTVEIIGDGAFAGCSNLSAIYAYATEPAHLAAAASRTRANDASSVFEGVDKENCVLYVPKGCGEKYRAAEGWGEFVQIIEMEGTGINCLSPCRNVFEVYDMNGRKVRTATTSLDGLPKGIYIVNGRKVMK